MSPRRRSRAETEPADEIPCKVCQQPLVRTLAQIRVNVSMHFECRAQWGRIRPIDRAAQSRAGKMGAAARAPRRANAAALAAADDVIATLLRDEEFFFLRPEEVVRLRRAMIAAYRRGYRNAWRAAWQKYKTEREQQQVAS
jgi:hypothetical protein